MPRLPNPDLESEILDAAHKLWKKAGEKGLTMRAVAQAAGTNTPAVYRRFRDRDDILRALLQRIRLDMAAHMEDASSVADGCEKYLDYAAAHPHEYELFFQKEYELFASARSVRAGVKPVERPVRDIMLRKLIEELGGSADSHDGLLMATLMLVHGAAMLMLTKTILPRDVPAARTVVRASVVALLRQGI